MRYNVSAAVFLSSRAKRAAWTANDSGNSPGEALIRIARRAREFLKNRHARRNPKLELAGFLLTISGKAQRNDLLPNDGSLDAQEFLDAFVDGWADRLENGAKGLEP